MPKTKTQTREVWQDTDDIVNDYIQGILSGVIPSNKYHRLCVERHVDDLQNAKDRGLEFRPEMGYAVYMFCNLTRHFEGPTAGQPFIPEPWELFLIWNIYGWYREDGTRRYRVAYIEIPRGNGKSFIASVLSLYALVADGESGAQVYAGATKMDQAQIIHEPSTWMVQASPALKDICELRVNTISVPSTHSKFKPISSDAKKQDGFKPHFTTLDELHEHPDGKLFDVIRSGMGKRLSPLLFAITTAGFNKHSFCKTVVHSRVEKILEGIVQDDAWFGTIFGVDDENKWDDPAEWVKANPNLGVSITWSDMEDMAKEARDSVTSLNNFKVKRLNIWTTSDRGWLDYEKWKRCPDLGITEEDLYGKKCYGGIDIGNTKDLAGLVWLFPWEDKKIILWPRCFIPKEYAEYRSRRDGVPYLQWAEDGYLILTDGETLDHEHFRDLFLGDCNKFNVQCCGYDPWNFHNDDQELIKAGVPRDKLVEVRQGPRSLSAGMKSLDCLYREGNLVHQNHPVMSWCATNVVSHQDRNENISPDKDKSTERIDLFTAANIAEAVRLIVDPPGPSVYEKRGLITI